jgi:hypothetical protein
VQASAARVIVAGHLVKILNVHKCNSHFPQDLRQPAATVLVPATCRDYRQHAAVGGRFSLFAKISGNMPKESLLQDILTNSSSFSRASRINHF